MSESPRFSDLAERRLQSVCLLILAAVATGAALQALGDVMIPFALAMFLAIALAPVVDALSARTRLSRPLSVGLTMVLGVLVLAVLGGVVAMSLSAYNQNFDVPGANPPAGEVVGEPSTQVAPEDGAAIVETAIGGALTPPLIKLLAPIELEYLVDPLVVKIEALVPRLMGVLGTLLSQGVTVLIFLMFLLVEQGRSDLAPHSDPTMGSTVRERVKQYISVKVLTSAVTGLVVGVALWAIGVPAAVLFGLLTFLLNFIPTIGSIVAVALPIPFLMMDEASLVTIALAVVIPGVIQFFVGQVWENKLLGDKFDLRASVVLLALVFWGKTWGIVGMLLATPITAVLKTMMEGQELTRPVARMMGQPHPDVVSVSERSSELAGSPEEPGAGDGA